LDEFDGKTINNSAIEYFSDNSDNHCKIFCRKKALFKSFSIQSKTKTNCELMQFSLEKVVFATETSE